MPRDRSTLSQNGKTQTLQPWFNFSPRQRHLTSTKQHLRKENPSINRNDSTHKCSGNNAPSRRAQPARTKPRIKNGDPSAFPTELQTVEISTPAISPAASGEPITQRQRQSHGALQSQTGATDHQKRHLRYLGLTLNRPPSSRQPVLKHNSMARHASPKTPQPVPRWRLSCPEPQGPRTGAARRDRRWRWRWPWCL